MEIKTSAALDAIKLGGITGQGMGEGILKESSRSSYRLCNSSNFRRVWFFSIYYDFSRFFIYFFQNYEKLF